MAEKEEQKMTLVEYLDGTRYKSGNDDLFVLVNGNITMETSRRYLESPAWKYLLQAKVISHGIAKNSRGELTILVRIEEAE